MLAKTEVLNTLKALKPELASQYKAVEVGLFGSFVRNEQNESSNMDLLVEFAEGADLFDLVGMALFLEEKFQRKRVRDHRRSDKESARRGSSNPLENTT